VLTLARAWVVSSKYDVDFMLDWKNIVMKLRKFCYKNFSNILPGRIRIRVSKLVTNAADGRRLGSMIRWCYVNDNYLNDNKQFAKFILFLLKKWRDWIIFWKSRTIKRFKTWCFNETEQEFEKTEYLGIRKLYYNCRVPNVFCLLTRWTVRIIKIQFKVHKHSTWN